MFYLLLQVHGGEGRSTGFAGWYVDGGLAVDQSPAAADGPENQPRSANEVFAGNRPEKTAVQTELGVVAHHEITVGRYMELFTRFVEVFPHEAQVSLITAFAAVNLLECRRKFRCRNKLFRIRRTDEKNVVDDLQRVSRKTDKAFYIIKTTLLGEVFVVCTQTFRCENHHIPTAGRCQIQTETLHKQMIAK